MTVSEAAAIHGHVAGLEYAIDIIMSTGTKEEAVHALKHAIETDNKRLGVIGGDQETTEDSTERSVLPEVRGGEQ